MIMIPIATQLIDVFYFVIYRAGRGMKKVSVGDRIGDQTNVGSAHRTAVQ